MKKVIGGLIFIGAVLIAMVVYAVVTGTPIVEMFKF